MKQREKEAEKLNQEKAITSHFCSTGISDGVLGLAGMELAFFMAAYIVLRFRFVARKVLIIHQCFNYCWSVLVQHHSLLHFSLCPSEQEIWEETQLGLTQSSEIFHT